MLRRITHDRWGEMNYEHYLETHPFMEPYEIEYWSQISRWDTFIKFRNGRKIIYEQLDDYERDVSDYDEYHLTDEQMIIEFTARLKRYMRLAGMTQEDLAEKLGISRATVSRWFQKRTRPDYNTIYKIARAIDVEPGDFFYREY